MSLFALSYYVCPRKRKRERERERERVKLRERETERERTITQNKADVSLRSAPLSGTHERLTDPT